VSRPRTPASGSSEIQSLSQSVFKNKPDFFTMFTRIVVSALVLVSLATSHFTMEYPEMRGDSFATGASQWIYPCKSHANLFHNFINMILTFLGANVDQTSATNRTLWPLTGGSLLLDLHHPWTYFFVNLGLGTDYPTFNITLTQQLLNETGNGTLCMPQVLLPSSYTPSDGQNASIQVVTVGDSGSALYNVSDPSMVSTSLVSP
jgi:hypothetical protein